VRPSSFRGRKSNKWEFTSIIKTKKRGDRQGLIHPTMANAWNDHEPSGGGGLLVKKRESLRAPVNGWIRVAVEKGQKKSGEPHTRTPNKVKGKNSIKGDSLQNSGVRIKGGRVWGGQTFTKKPHRG